MTAPDPAGAMRLFRGSRHWPEAQREAGPVSKTSVREDRSLPEGALAMAQSLSRCKTAALRELFEGAPPTLPRLAAAAGRLPARLISTAQRERWGERPAELGAGERAVRLAALGDWLI